MKLNRKQKICRNFLVCLLLCLATHAAMGFPPYTVEGMCAQVARDYLLPEAEPIYVHTEKHKYSGDVFNRTYTYVIARCEDHYLAFLYDRDLLINRREAFYGVELEQDVLCTARKGMLYAAGDFGEEDSRWQLEETPVEEMDLSQIARYWYRTPHGDSGYSYDHAELPLTLTLYNKEGEVLRTVERSVGTYDLHLWI